MDINDIAPPEEPEMLIALSMEELEQVSDKLRSLQTEDFELAVHQHSNIIEEEIDVDIDKTENSTNEAVSWRQFRPLFEESFVNQTSETFEYTLMRASHETMKLTFEQIPRLAARVDGDIPLNDATIGCETEASSATGAVIWDSSLVVARFLEFSNHQKENKYKVRGKKCFELGAGCGLLSCVLWHLGANIVASERSEILPLLNRNIKTNCCDIINDQAIDISPEVKVINYMWGDDIDPQSHGGPFDMILAIDCIYDESAAEILFESLKLLTNHWLSSCKVIIGVDESYKRPLALNKFMSLVESADLVPIEISLIDNVDDCPETVKLWSIEARTKKQDLNI